MSGEPYIAHRVRKPIELDGRLSDPAWALAPRSHRFVDMATGEPAILDTQIAALWDDTNLYVGFWVEDPYPKASLVERDTLIFLENDVEIFIDGGDCYYEFELNALNTVYEVFFIWKDAYERGGRFDVPEFDVLGPRALTFAGNFDREGATFWKGTHPRGPRWAFLDWDFPGVRTAVHVDGTLNDLSAPSRGWTAEIAFPWAGFGHLAGGRSIPPTSGDLWRIFFGRFEQLAFGDEVVQAAWCLSPHGVYDTHMPEKFTPVVFSDGFID